MLTKDEKGRYVTILADGKFHETVPQGTDEAIEREYETSDGKKGVKHELIYTKIEANIVDVSFKDGDYGMSLHLKFKDQEGNEVIVSVNTASNFGEDAMKKLPNIDFTKKVTMSPFSFIDEKDRSVKGVTFWQNGEKVKNYFKNDEKELINGFPKPDADTSGYDKDDWKMYFITVRKFLVKHIQENIIPKFSVSHAKDVEYPENHLSDDDRPF
jgi:hypothetical protein